MPRRLRPGPVPPGEPPLPRQWPESFDALVDELRAGRLDDDIPPHGTLAARHAPAHRGRPRRRPAAVDGPPSRRGSPQRRRPEEGLMAVTEAPRIVTGRLAPRRLPHPRALPGHRRVRGLRKALQLAPEAVADEVDAASLLGRGGAGFPAGASGRCCARRDHLPGGQRRRERAGHLQGPPPRRARPPSAHRGRAHRRLRHRRSQAFIYVRGEFALGARAGRRPRSTRPTPPGPSARTSSGRGSRSTWWCTPAPAPTSAARRRRCSRASRASAASPASSRPSSRPPSASTASPPWSTTWRRCPTCPG